MLLNEICYFFNPMKMMFYSPFELFTNISNDDITEFNRIQSLPKRTSYEKMKHELLETEFNKKFLSKVNKEFFANIIKKLDERIIFLRGEMNKSIKIEKPEKTLNDDDKNKILNEIVNLMLSRI